MCQSALSSSKEFWCKQAFSELKKKRNQSLWHSALPPVCSRVSGCRKKLSSTQGGRWRWVGASGAQSWLRCLPPSWSLGVLGGACRGMAAPAQVGPSAGV